MLEHFLRPLPPVSSPLVRVESLRVRIREIRPGDGEHWSRLRIAGEQWLRPVEPTPDEPWGVANSRARWREVFRYLREERMAGRVFPMAIIVEGEFAGQVTLSDVQFGRVSTCRVWYWVDRDLWGKGVATAAVALAVDFACSQLRLHRVEATALDSNPGSQRVLEKLGFQREGVLRGAIHVDGRWQDHPVFGLTVEDLPAQGLMHGLFARGVLFPL